MRFFFKIVNKLIEVWCFRSVCDVLECVYKGVGWGFCVGGDVVLVYYFGKVG